MMLGQTQQQSTCGGVSGGATSAASISSYSGNNTATLIANYPGAAGAQQYNKSMSPGTRLSPNHSPNSPYENSGSSPTLTVGSGVKCQSVYSSIEKLLATNSASSSSPPPPLSTGGYGRSSNVLSGNEVVNILYVFHGQN